MAVICQYKKNLNIEIQVVSLVVEIFGTLHFASKVVDTFLRRFPENKGSF